MSLGSLLFYSLYYTSPTPNLSSFRLQWKIYFFSHSSPFPYPDSWSHREVAPLWDWLATLYSVSLCSFSLLISLQSLSHLSICSSVSLSTCICTYIQIFLFEKQTKVPMNLYFLIISTLYSPFLLKPCFLEEYSILAFSTSSFAMQLSLQCNSAFVLTTTHESLSTKGADDLQVEKYNR